MSATSRASPPRDNARTNTRDNDCDHNDAGMVTVEAAIALCAFVTVLAMVLAGTSSVLDQIRCTDAAREAARLVARGDQDRAREAVSRIAPHGATLAVTTDGDTASVVVRDPEAGGLLPGVQVGATAFAVLEPADVPDPADAPDQTDAPDSADSPDQADVPNPANVQESTGQAPPRPHVPPSGAPDRASSGPVDRRSRSTGGGGR